MADEIKQVGISPMEKEINAGQRKLITTLLNWATDNYRDLTEGTEPPKESVYPSLSPLAEISA